jgi:hypothetical protein
MSACCRHHLKSASCLWLHLMGAGCLALLLVVARRLHCWNASTCQKAGW